MAIQHHASMLSQLMRRENHPHAVYTTPNVTR